MATKTLNTRIQLRNDLKATWEQKNPVLLVGEVGIELDTNKIKIGDGITAWSDLPYAGADEQQIKDLIAAEEDNFTTVVPNADEEDTAAIARVCTEPKKGDICVIKREFTTGKYSYTGYVYDGSNWGAMDGNYNAENVYFKQDFTYTAGIGALTAPTAAEGSKTLAATGKNIKEVLATILAKEKYPTVTQPSVSITVKRDGGTPINSNLAVEYGTTVALSCSMGQNNGSYTYGPATGVTWTAAENKYELYNGSSISETKTASTTASFSVKVESGDSYSVKFTGKHSAGVTPLTNLGNDATIDHDGAEGSKVSAIAAGTKTATSKTITGYKMGRFYGTSSTKITGAPTSAQVRALSKNNSATTTGTFEFDVPVGASTIIIAVADTTAGARKLTSVLNTTVNAEMGTSFTKYTNVTVNGADNTAANGGSYTVWTYSPAEAYGSSAHLKVTIG